MHNNRIQSTGQPEWKHKSLKKTEVVGLLLTIVSVFFTYSLEAAIEQIPGDSSTEINKQKFNQDPATSYNVEKFESNLQRLERQARSKDYKNKAIKLARQGKEHLLNGATEQGLKDLEQAWAMAPNLIQAGILIADTYIQEKEYGKALKAADKIQGIKPDEASGYALAGLAYSGLGKAKQSRAAFDKALQIQPGYPNAILGLATLATQEGKYDQARTQYLELLADNPGHLPILIQLARLENQSGHPQKAISLLKEAIEKHPDNPRPRILLARLYLAINDIANALVITDSAVKQFPQHAGLLELRSIALIKSGSPSAAIPLLKSAAQISPSTVSPHYNLALAYEQLNENTMALQETELALKINAEHGPSLFLSARMLAKTGQFDAALKRLKILQSSYPDNPEIIALQGRIAMAQNHPDQAIALFQQALKIKESNVLVIQLAMAQNRAGKQEKGYATLRNWLQKNPKDINTRIALADQLLANGKLAEAQIEYSKIVTLQPENVAAHNNIAWLLTEQGDWEQSQVHAEKAYNLAPENASVKDTLGVILLHQGQTEQALKLLQSAAKHVPDNPSINFHLAQAYVQNGEKDSARIILTTLLSDKAKFAERQQAQTLLESLNVN